MARRSSRRGTIQEVARLAGVSPATVSRVVNNSPRCSPETRKRVLDAVAQIGYVPDHVARSLKTGNVGEIALAVPDIGNPVYVAMAKAVQEVAARRGWWLSLASTEGSQTEELRALRALAGRRIDGLIITSLTVSAAFLRELEPVQGRVVVIGRVPDETPVDNVRVESETGARLAVEHLIDLGCQRIGFINGMKGTVPSTSRISGYKLALGSRGLEYSSNLVVNSDFTIMGGYEAIDRLLEQCPDLDGVFAANDAMAIGVLRKLRERSMRVPDDVAVIGMDDIDLCRIATPTLSTVTLLAAERGRIAGELLLDRVEGRERGEWQRVTVLPRLLVRESTSLLRKEQRGTARQGPGAGRPHS
ncbi:LacI family DNA-binding transcriptional regulator [Limnochorda pilosa]|uniref:LacI family transcriptional regulator n=1 Tax=Limnochorda pilosa TaxID=1555112 RepID=A0A0K2SLY5_LIMPI|nr:LacI family DNA-binding transcriptional regulator [Limnochorda pilosa]BAS28128.1 LacI family transcriptional regulator [Limnochorda pilosa]